MLTNVKICEQMFTIVNAYQHTLTDDVAFVNENVEKKACRHICNFAINLQKSCLLFNL